MNQKAKNVLKLTIKIVVIILAYYYAIDKIVNSADIDKFSQYFIDLDWHNLLWLFLLILLMPVNWILESIKWKQIVEQTEYISLIDSIKAICTGVTVGTITPNRVGEFCGRILFVKPENRIKASYLTIWGDISQLLATLVFGIIGISLFSEISLGSTDTHAILIVGIIVTVLFIVLYAFFDRILEALKDKDFIKKYCEKYIPQCEISYSRKIYTALYSLGRYLIFCTQFYLSLKFFGVEIPFYEAMISIFSTYLCIYIIPNIAVAELGIRTSFAIIFIGFFSEAHTGIMLSSLLLYLVNVAVPIICGGIILLRKK